jgi:hypothetical protein
MGIQGNDQILTLTVSKYTRELSTNPDQTVCDLRRIDYWYVNNGDKSGLARREIKLVTTQDPNDSNMDPTSLPDQTPYIVAPEVKSISFQYWNGTDWTGLNGGNIWDGTQLGPDGLTPYGPPAAIAITIELVPPAGAAADSKGPVYRHVISIPTANIVPNS